MDRVAVVADHERRLAHLAPAPRGAARPGRRRGPGAPRRRASGPGSPSRASCRRAASSRGARRRAAAPMARATGAPKVSPTSSGVKAMRAAEQRVVQHGHLDQEPLHAVGRRRGGLERGVGAQRRAADAPPGRRRGGRAARSSGARRSHRVVPHLRRAVRVAVAEQVEAEHAVAALRRASPPAAGASCARRAGPGRSTTTLRPCRTRRTPAGARRTRTTFGEPLRRHNSRALASGCRGAARTTWEER